MSYDACAELVARGDPHRFRAALSAPPDRRRHLMALYAFNLEVARAPWVTQEPMIAEMRLQWWVDAVAEIYAGASPRAHEVTTPLAETIRETALPEQDFQALISARRGDIYPDAPADADALWAYLDATSGGLTALAAHSLGAAAEAVALARLFGQGTGAASYLAAAPRLAAAGRRPFPDGLPNDDLAREAQTRLAKARSRRASVPAQARAAFWGGGRADHILAQVITRPDTPPVEPSEFRLRWQNLRTAISGAW